MTSILTNSTLIGQLEILEVYEYVDGPKLFSCRNQTGQVFLGLWVGDSSGFERFWLVAMSQVRHAAVRSGGLTLKRAFEQPELGFTYLCSISSLTGDASIEVVPIDRIDQYLLPDEEEKLMLYTETLTSRFAEFGIPQKAVASQREVIGLHLTFGNLYREEAPAKGLGRILVSTQEIIDALGQSVDGVATMRGAISPEILTATEARVIQAGGGSFALEIGAAQSVDLFGRSLIGDAIDRLVSLIALGNEVEVLREFLLEIKPRAVSKYRDLLIALVDYEGSLTIERASPQTSRNQTVSLDLQTAAGALKTVEQVTSEVGETIQGLGVFVGVEIPRKAFTAILGERTFRGKILAAALPQAEHVTINALYTLKIRETIEVTSSGEERLRYELEEIAQYRPE